jgi:hypothetical protein
MTTDELKALLDKARDTFCLASPGSDEEFAAYLSGFDSASQIALSHCNALREREARLAAALRAVEADCLERAAFSRDGKTAPIGDGAWRGLCNVLAEIEKEAGE